MAICLRCLKIGGSPDLCDYCAECSHLCRGKCSTITRIKKQDNIEREKNRRYAVKDEPVKKGYVPTAYDSYRAALD